MPTLYLPVTVSRYFMAHLPLLSVSSDYSSDFLYLSIL